VFPSMFFIIGFDPAYIKTSTIWILFIRTLGCKGVICILFVGTSNFIPFSINNFTIYTLELATALWRRVYPSI